jgi:hypothetical protein
MQQTDDMTMHPATEVLMDAIRDVLVSRMGLDSAAYNWDEDVEGLSDDVWNLTYESFLALYHSGLISDRISDEYCLSLEKA